MAIPVPPTATPTETERFPASEIAPPIERLLAMRREQSLEALAVCHRAFDGAWHMLQEAVAAQARSDSSVSDLVQHFATTFDDRLRTVLHAVQTEADRRVEAAAEKVAAATLEAERLRSELTE